MLHVLVKIPYSKDCYYCQHEYDETRTTKHTTAFKCSSCNIPLCKQTKNTNVGIYTLPMASLKRDTTNKFKRWWILKHVQRLLNTFKNTKKLWLWYIIIFKQIFCSITNGKKVLLCKYIIRYVSMVSYITRTFWRLTKSTRLKVLNIQCFFCLFLVWILLHFVLLSVTKSSILVQETFFISFVHLEILFD